MHLKDLIPTALLIHNSTFKTAWIVIGFILQETIEEPKFVDLHAASQMWCWLKMNSLILLAFNLEWYVKKELISSILGLSRVVKSSKFLCDPKSTYPAFSYQNPYLNNS